MKFILLTKGKYAKVDDAEYDLLMQWKWHESGRGYAERKEYRNGKQIHVQMHRQILNAPKGKMVDHINGDTYDNRRKNLRFCTKSTNAMNMRKHKGKSVYKGVSPEGSGFRVQIWLNGKPAFRVMTKQERHAAMIYDLNAPALFGEYARSNFTGAEVIGKLI